MSENRRKDINIIYRTLKKNPKEFTNDEIKAWLRQGFNHHWWDKGAHTPDPSMAEVHIRESEG